MAAKKKTANKKTTKTKNKKKTSPKRIAKPATSGKKLHRGSVSPKKRLAKNQSTKNKSTKKVAIKRKSAAKKTAPGKKAAPAKRRGRASNATVDLSRLSLGSARARSGGQSGDLQGLSDVEGVATESVDELLEEGNAFEAGIVSGVQSAGNADEEEVRTHEVLEDDVPDEYLKNDR